MEVVAVGLAPETDGGWTDSKQKIGTLLFDLLTVEEDSVYENRFNIDLLVSRLIETTEWFMNYNEAKSFTHRLFELVQERLRHGQRPIILWYYKSGGLSRRQTWLGFKLFTSGDSSNIT
jgi:hypothetical protein